jgi:hypothetical protein
VSLGVIAPVTVTPRSAEKGKAEMSEKFREVGSANSTSARTAATSTPPPQFVIPAKAGTQ